MNYLEHEEQLSPQQFGFRRARSTTDALVRLTDDVFSAYREKQHLVGVFFDLEKAYDTTWRFGILRAMHECGIRGHMAFFILNFLRQRRFTTRLTDVSSGERLQEEGVPQGSVLSCTLFALAINNILRQLPATVSGSLYVDDLVIYASSAYLPGLERRLQVAINALCKWCTENGFAFSPTKTVAINFHRTRHAAEPSLYLENHPISFVQSTRFLGLVLDTRLSWVPHIRQLKQTCARALSVLRCLSHLTWGADRRTLLRVYRSLIRSKMDYGSIVFSSAKPSALRLLDPVHNSAIRLCTGAFRSSPVLSLYAESGEPSLNARRDLLMLQYLARAQQLPNSPSCLSIIQQWPTTARRVRESFGSRARETCARLHLTVQTTPISFCNTPRWLLSPSVVCPGFMQGRKSDHSTDGIKSLFLDHVNTCHRQCMHIYTDGSKDEGRVGCAAVSDAARSSLRLHGYSSIFTAELYGIICAVAIANKSTDTEICIFSDSMSAIQAILHYNSPHPLVTTIHRWLIRLSTRQKTVTFCWVPGHVRVAGNEAADELSRNAAAGETPHWNESVPHRDHYPIIRKKLLDEWQEEWTHLENNKLRKIKEDVRPWPSSSHRVRRVEVCLTRLRIGHSRITHGHLMERAPAPYCMDCLVPQTVTHFLCECPSYGDARRQFFPYLCQDNPDANLNSILAQPERGNYNVDRLVEYLRAINAFDYI